MKRKIVVIQWEDSWGDPGVSREIMSPGFMTSSGFLLEKNKKYITIAMSILMGGEYREQLSIPMSQVKKYKVVGEVEVKI